MNCFTHIKGNVALEKHFEGYKDMDRATVIKKIREYEKILHEDVIKFKKEAGIKYPAEQEKFNPNDNSSAIESIKKEYEGKINNIKQQNETAKKESNPALRDVESTAKALGGLSKDKIDELKNHVLSKLEGGEKINAENISLNKIAEYYHKIKGYGFKNSSNNPIVKAVEELLNNKNETAPKEAELSNTPKEEGITVEEPNQNSKQTEEEGLPPKEPIDNNVIEKLGDDEMTKMANAINDAHIEGKFGTDALDKMASQLQDTDVKKLYNNVKARIQKGTLSTKDVRDRILTTKTGNEADQVALLYDLADLKGKERSIQKDIIGSDNKEETGRLQDRLISVQNEIMDNALANKYIGRQASSIFRARQLWANKETNLVDMVDEYKAAKGIKELTPEQENEIKVRYNMMQESKLKLDAAKNELDKAVKENEQLKKENEALQKLKVKTDSQKKADRKIRTDEAIQKSNDRIKKSKEALQSIINDAKKTGITPKPQPFLAPKMVAEISKIAAEKFYQGAVRFDKLIGDVLDEIKDILPNWKEEDVIKHLLTEQDKNGNFIPSKAASDYIASKEKLDIEQSNKNLKNKIAAYEKAQKEVALQNFEWSQERRSDLMEHKSSKEKIIDSILRWQRFSVLSYPSTIVKLAAVVGHQLTFKPFKFGVQALIGNLPFIKNRAAIWGSPKLNSLARYYSTFIRNFSLENLKEQFSGVDTKEILYGKPFIYDEWASGKGLLEMPGRSHGYIKSFIKNPEFQYAHEQQIAFHLKKMEDVKEEMSNPNISESQKEKLQKEYDKYDVTNEDVLERINKLSLEHGKWSILMNDNKFVEKFQKFTKDAGVGGALIKSEIPIVKIPTNYIGRYFALKYGLINAVIGKPKWMGKENNFKGIAQLLIKGTKDFSNDEAELLSKTLTVGSIGAAFFTTGYLLRNNVKKNDDGSVDVGDIHISKNLAHSPELETFFNGADMGKDKKGNMKWLQNFTENDIEVFSKNPFLQQLQYGFLPNMGAAMVDLVHGKHAGDVNTFTGKAMSAIGKKVGDMTIPGFVKQPAQWMDTKEGGFSPTGDVNKRVPQGSPLDKFWQQIELGVPVLRKNVQERESVVESDKQNPSLKYFLDKGMELPNTLLSSEIITDNIKNTKQKISDYPKDVQENYKKVHNKELSNELGNILKIGTAFVKTYKKPNGEEVEEVSMTAPVGGGKIVKIGDMSKEELAQLLKIAQSNATKIAKLKVFR